MFGSGFRSKKFSTTARLSINRLKLLEKKKTEQAQKARKEIAEYLAMGKDERARIRVEHIIRDDYLVEGMEIVELYLDLLLARLGVITSTKEIDPSIQEAVASVIWVAPRLSAEVAELKMVAEQLVYKYGKEFCHSIRKEECDFINEGLKHKLGVQAPSRRLVENYLVEIARSHNVPYEPDPCVLNPPDIDGLLVDLGDEVLSGSKRGGGGGSGGGGMSVTLPPQQQNYAPPAQAYPPPAQAYPPPAQAFPPAAQGYPPPAAQTHPAANPAYPPPLQTYPPTAAPPYSENDPMYPPNPQQQSQGPSAPRPETVMPVLPQVPTNSFPPLDNSVGGNSAGGEDVDFDDLSRRFEELKKKK